MYAQFASYGVQLRQLRVSRHRVCALAKVAMLTIGRVALNSVCRMARTSYFQSGFLALSEVSIHCYLRTDISGYVGIRPLAGPILLAPY
jgi:hypothetical protein